MKKRTAKAKQAGQASTTRFASKLVSSVLTDGDAALEVLVDRISKLESSVDSLSSDNSRLDPRVGSLEKKNASLKSEF